MDKQIIRQAAILLGFNEPISIEPDLSIWTGSSDVRVDLTKAQHEQVLAKAAQLAEKKLEARDSAFAKLVALGLTDDEIAALVGG